MVTIEKTNNGYFIAYAIKNNQLFHKKYVGYYKKEIIKDFKKYLKKIN